MIEPRTMVGSGACQIPPPFTVKSVAKLPYNPRIWKTLLKAHFHQFMTVFGDCSISKIMFKKNNR